MIEMQEGRKRLGQYHTPLWLCERIVDLYFGHLTPRDLVLEPSCGYGRFLQALPKSIPAIGVEIDPALASEAERRSGRRIIVGDFCTVDLDVEPSAIIGNPPFNVELIGRFLDRAHRLLPEGGRAGFILPCYALQTAATVVGYARKWSIKADMIPRNGFHARMMVPLSFVVFSKETDRVLVGLALFHETEQVHDTHPSFRALLDEGRPHKSAWRAVVEAALEYLGGEAELREIYRMVEGARPTENKFWHEKVRQIAQKYCERTGDAKYALRREETAAL